MVNGIGNHLAKNLFNHFGSAKNIFKEKTFNLKKIQGIGALTAKNIKDFNQFDEALEELQFIQKNNIQFLTYFDPKFPKRLKEIDDSPLVLFTKGNAELNASRMLAIVGTRTPTQYGKQFTEMCVEALKPYNVTIVSGLAAGIDSIAHKSCVINKIPTIGVLGHGLSTIYPSGNKHLSNDIIKNGALVSEFRFHTPGNKENFPRRNRIVAAMCDTIVVVESGIKGGSMITADLANQYNRDVFALPGKITDVFSQGCNKLIANNQAAIIDSISTLIDSLGYDVKKKQKPQQQNLQLLNLNEDEKSIYNILFNGEKGIDDLLYTSEIPLNRMALVLLDMEFKGLLKMLPGKRYCLIKDMF